MPEDSDAGFAANARFRRLSVTLIVRHERMRAFQIVRLLGFAAILLSLSACRTAPPTKQEAADWYALYAPLVRWVGYQGSDEQFHYFIARVMDAWKFIRIGRDELVMDDQRPYSTTSSAPLYHYLVDPSREYTKIKTEGEPLSSPRGQ